MNIQDNLIAKIEEISQRLEKAKQLKPVCCQVKLWKSSNPTCLSNIGIAELTDFAIRLHQYITSASALTIVPVWYDGSNPTTTLEQVLKQLEYYRAKSDIPVLETYCKRLWKVVSPDYKAKYLLNKQI